MMCIAHSNFKKLELVVIKYVKIIEFDVFIKILDVFTANFIELTYHTQEVFTRSNTRCLI